MVDYFCCSCILIGVHFGLQEMYSILSIKINTWLNGGKEEVNRTNIQKISLLETNGFINYLLYLFAPA